PSPHRPGSNRQPHMASPRPARAELCAGTLPSGGNPAFGRTGQRGPLPGRPTGRGAVQSEEGVSFVITDGFLFISLLLAISAGLVVAGNSGRFKVFKYVPGFVFLYIVAALLNTVGLFDHDAIDGVGDGVQDALLPAMILLLLFKCDVRQIVRLGPKLLLTYAVTAASIMVGFIVAYLIVHSALAPESWKALGALNASWTGGSANMVAVQDILEAPEDIFGYVLIVDTVLYSFWLLLIFSSVAVSDRFNRWTKADISKFDFADRVTGEEEKPMTLPSIIGLLGFSLLVSALAAKAGELLPEVGVVINASAWTSLIVRGLGLAFGSSRWGRPALPAGSAVAPRPGPRPSGRVDPLAGGRGPASTRDLRALACDRRARRPARLRLPACGTPVSGGRLVRAARASPRRADPGRRVE